MKHYRPLLSVLLLFWLLASPAWGQNTHGVPNQLQEMQATISDLLQPGILPQQCNPAVPVSSLTVAAFSCKGYVASGTTPPTIVYVNQPAQAITFPNVAGTYWLALHLNTSDTVASWTRISGSHYLYRTSSGQPVNPTNGLIFAQVTVTSVVTAIDPVNVGKAASRQLGVNIVPEFATSGDGTGGNPWVGWDTKIDWTRNNQTYWFSPGTYNFASGITISGAGVKLICAGYENTLLQYTAATGIAINVSASPNSAVEFELGYCKITATDTTAIKRAINLVDIRNSYLHDFWINAWYGGGASIGIRVFGRDTTVFERFVSDAERPFVVSQDPLIPNSSEDFDTMTVRDAQIGQFVTNTPAAFPCFEAEDFVALSRFRTEGFVSAVRCKHMFYWNAPSATASAQGGVVLNGWGWEQNTDQTGYLVYINYGPGGTSAVRVSDVHITNVFGGSVGQGIYLKGVQDVATLDNVWYTGWVLNTNNAGVPLKVDAQQGAGIGVIGSIAGGSITGSVGQTCTVNTYSNCNSLARGIVVLTGTNAIANGTVVNYNNQAGASCTKKPTTAALANGTATCSGTITFSSADVQGDGTFTGVDLRGVFMDGDPTVGNSGGLDPCDGSGGAPTGTHSCMLGMVKLRSDNVKPGDLGRSAFWAGNFAASPFPNFTIMGQTISFPTLGGVPVSTASASGALGSNQTVIAFQNLIDCPTGLNPCSGTFHLLRVRVTVFSDDQSVHEAADVYVNPFTWSNFPNVVTCLSCSANILVNASGAGKFSILHATQLPPNGFFGFANGFGVTVRWMAVAEIIY